MFIRRGAFGTLFLVGLGVLFGALLSSEAAGSLMAAPFVALAFLFKVMLFILLMSLVARAFGFRTRGWHGTASRRWAEQATRWHARPEAEARDEGGLGAAQRFEDWHRMAHARQEVDESVPPVED